MDIDKGRWYRIYSCFKNICCRSFSVLDKMAGDSNFPGTIDTLHQIGDPFIITLINARKGCGRD